MQKHSKCTTSKIAWFLIFIGGINWGLVGLGMILGGSEWNLVKMIFGGMPTIEAIIYLLVGIAAVVSLFGCKCKTCKGEMPTMSAPQAPTGGDMGHQM